MDLGKHPFQCVPHMVVNRSAQLYLGEKKKGEAGSQIHQEHTLLPNKNLGPKARKDEQANCTRKHQLKCKRQRRTVKHKKRKMLAQSRVISSGHTLAMLLGVDSGGLKVTVGHQRDFYSPQTCQRLLEMRITMRPCSLNVRPIQMKQFRLLGYFASFWCQGNDGQTFVGDFHECENDEN